MEGEGDTGTSDILKPSADTGFVLAAFPKLKVSSLKPLQSPICLDRPQSRKLQAGNPFTPPHPPSGQSNQGHSISVSTRVTSGPAHGSAL